MKIKDQWEYVLPLGTQVMHGSPGYETLEVIKSITDKGSLKVITFESDCFTLINEEDLERLLDEGSVHYLHPFPDGNAHASMILVH